MSLRGGAVLIAVVLCATALGIQPSYGELVGLYEESDLVEILDSNNFNAKVIESDTAYVIQFYNAFCGHCIRFSTSWKEFAIQIYGWRQFVKVGVIDCSNQLNSQTCRNYEIMGYPSIRFIPPRPAPNNIGNDVSGSTDIQIMKNNLIDQLQETQSSGHLSSLCDIQPYANSSLMIDSNSILTYVIIDTTQNKFAQELIIDYCPVKKVNMIYALNSNLALVEQLNTKIYPSLYRIQNYEFKLLASGDNKSQFIEIINEDLENNSITPFNIIEVTTKLYNLLFKKSHGLDDDASIIYLSDLEATLKYSLVHEIVSRNVISGESLEALKSYLELLIEYFPTSLRGKKLIKLVSENIRYNNTVSGQNLRNFIDKYELFLKPYITKLNWIGCDGSNIIYRRYPCGLWTLFHTLTVQASTKDNNVFTGIQVLETITGYVKHFFGCTDCSEHFLRMATSIKDNVTSLDDAVLWLWSAHNEVNQRLAGDVTEDPKYPKILFPLKVHCPECRMNDTGNWNTTAVLCYLKKKVFYN